MPQKSRLLLYQHLPGSSSGLRRILQSSWCGAGDAALQNSQRSVASDWGHRTRVFSRFDHPTVLSGNKLAVQPVKRQVSWLCNHFGGCFLAFSRRVVLHIRRCQFDCGPLLPSLFGCGRSESTDLSSLCGDPSHVQDGSSATRYYGDSRLKVYISPACRQHWSGLGSVVHPMFLFERKACGIISIRQDTSYCIDDKWSKNTLKYTELEGKHSKLDSTFCLSPHVWDSNPTSLQSFGRAEGQATQPLAPAQVAGLRRPVIQGDSAAAVLNVACFTRPEAGPQIVGSQENMGETVIHRWWIIQFRKFDDN